MRRIICSVSDVLIWRLSRILKKHSALSADDLLFRDIYMYHFLHEMRKRGVGSTVTNEAVRVKDHDTMLISSNSQCVQHWRSWGLEAVLCDLATVFHLSERFGICLPETTRFIPLRSRT
jgi:hypothetical protein